MPFLAVYRHCGASMALRRNESYAVRLLFADRQVVAANADLHRVSQRRMAQHAHGLAAGEAEFGQALRNAVRARNRVDVAVFLRGEVGECLHGRLGGRWTFPAAGRGSFERGIDSQVSRRKQHGKAQEWVGPPGFSVRDAGPRPTVTENVAPFRATLLTSFRIFHILFLRTIFNFN